MEQSLCRALYTSYWQFLQISHGKPSVLNCSFVRNYTLWCITVFLRPMLANSILRALISNRLLHVECRHLQTTYTLQNSSVRYKHSLRYFGPYLGSKPSKEKREMSPLQDLKASIRKRPTALFRSLDATVAIFLSHKISTVIIWILQILIAQFVPRDQSIMEFHRVSSHYRLFRYNI